MTYAEKWKRIGEIDAEYDQIAKRQTELSREKTRLLMTETPDNPHRRKRKVTPVSKSVTDAVQNRRADDEVTLRELRKHYV